ncbi:hypothetical protein Sjap_012060 [Stephania japonica]|uniref:Uncharacterized protein n=1 Tax=Stephania japonica TaxID=461633 RepID=A0AAP0P5J6_9MAGN
MLTSEREMERLRVLPVPVAEFSSEVPLSSAGEGGDDSHEGERGDCQDERDVRPKENNESESENRRSRERSRDREGGREWCGGEAEMEEKKGAAACMKKKKMNISREPEIELLGELLHAHRKLRVNDGDEGEGELEESQAQCPDCNENGLIVCPFCC